MSNRRVSQLQPKQASGESEHRILDYLNYDLIILLGDPGAGKSYCFREMAEAENAPLYTVRKFMSLNGGDQAATVYLDGLDEYRPQSVRADSNSLINLLQIVSQMAMPRLRLSCRFADWLGATDLELFEGYRRNGPFAVIALRDLDAEDRIEILATTNVKDPREFIKEASAREMEWATSNPQHLLMIADIVQDSGWPATKHDLYQRWVIRNLTERKGTLSRSPLGSYSPEELLDPAGAACSMLLIADVSSLALVPQSSEEVPSYREVPHPSPDEVLAALSRPAFKSTEAETATYAHRTIAEFLGARWLGKKVSDGMPFTRLQSLLGIDAHPTPSLRGIHAWLATFLPREAEIIVSKDPIGVLAYGDVAVLAPSHKRLLVESLARLAEENPLLFTEPVPAYGLAALSCADTGERLASILQSSGTRPALKTVVFRSIQAGSCLPCYLEPLKTVLKDATALEPHRVSSLRCLLGFGAEVRLWVADLYRSTIKVEHASIGLKAAILGYLYGQPFHAGDVVELFEQTSVFRSTVAGELWPLIEQIPTKGLLEVVEEYLRRASAFNDGVAATQNGGVSFCIERMLGRLIEEIPHTDAQAIDRLLIATWRLHAELPDVVTGNVNVYEIAVAKPALIEALIESAIRHMHDFKYPADAAWILSRTTSGAITLEAVGRHLCAAIERKEDDESRFDKKSLAIYEALGRCFSGPRAYPELFERFLRIGESHAECSALLERFTRCPVDQARLARNESSWGPGAFREETKLALRANLALIERGGCPLLQARLGRLYFGHYAGDGRNQIGKQLSDTVGPELTQLVEKGFKKLLESPPTLSEIFRLHEGDELGDNWYAFLAGVDIEWKRHNNLDSLSATALCSAFALSLILSQPDLNKPESWPCFIAREKAETVVYVSCALIAQRACQGVNIKAILSAVSGLPHIRWRSQVAFQSLQYPSSADSYDLVDLFSWAMESRDTRRGMLAVVSARNFEFAASATKLEMLWTVAGFLFARDGLEAKFVELIRRDPEIIWTFRSMARAPLEEIPDVSSIGLGISQLQIAIQGFGTEFPMVAPPPEGSWGDRTPYDAAQYIRELISAIAAKPEPEAGRALAALLRLEELRTYHYWIQNQLGQHREVSRRSRYERPTWKAVRGTLTGGAPANVEDLRALITAHLVAIVQEIRFSNIDQYKVFWHGADRAPGKPQDEEFCRDRLLGHLRNRLQSGIHAEPEGHMAADKRADIVVQAPPDLKLPIELKRDSHRDLWTAAETQLSRLYITDPKTQGYGIYGVFYFGPGRNGSVTPRKDGGPLVDSAESLREALQSTVPLENRDRITVVVIDVSPPPR